MIKEWSTLTRNFIDCETCKYKSTYTGGCYRNSFYTSGIKWKRS